MTKYAKTQKEARDWVNETLGKTDHGLTFDGAQLTLSEYMESWLSGKELARSPMSCCRVAVGFCPPGSASPIFGTVAYGFTTKYGGKIQDVEAMEAGRPDS